MVLFDWILVAFLLLISIPGSKSDSELNTNSPSSDADNSQEYGSLDPNSQFHQVDPRSLQYTPKVYIKLQDPTYINKILVLTIEGNQIPTPIRLEFVSAETYAYAEFSNSFSGPITLDISYLTTGGFLKFDYVGNYNFQGIPVSRPISNLIYNENVNMPYSTTFIGYFLGPLTGQVIFKLKYDDNLVVWIQDSKVFDRGYQNYNPIDLQYNFIKDRLYYTAINLTSDVVMIGLECTWNASGVWSNIPGANMLYPTRISNMPFELSNNGIYNIYCDDVGGFSCIVCDIPMCLECEQTKSAKKCKLCKTNFYLSGSICSCNPGYYLSPSDNTNCLVCTGLCDECEEVSGVIKCKTCQNNSSLSLGVCTCNPGYYLSASNYRMCIQCTGLCDIILLN
jgi:hypothetical protein